MIIANNFFRKINGIMRFFLIVVFSFFLLQGFAQMEPIKDSVIKSKFADHLPENNKIEDIKTSLKVYPNPAKNKITLDVSGFDAGLVTVKIIDTKGKIWREDHRLLTNGTEEIIMFLMLPAGVYFISLNEKAKIIKKKLIVQ